MKFATSLRAFFLCAAFVTSAVNASPVDVVKIINFSCPVCRASETLDNSIQSAVAATGGRFVPAPIPPDNTTFGARERVYYASRDLSVNAEPLIRTSMFKGAQDMSMSLSDIPQTVAWLEDDLSSKVNLDWSQLIQNADAPAAKQSLAKAVRLAISSGAQALPTYIVLKQGVIVGTLDPDSIPNKSLLNLRDAVVTAVTKASNAPN